LSDSAPARWLVLEVPRALDEDRQALLVEQLLSWAPQGVEERPTSLVVYLPDPIDAPEEIAQDVGRQLAEALGESDPIEVRTEWQAHHAWSEIWRTGFRPRRITDRLTVAPSWDLPDCEPGEIVLTLDPGMAFGTAEHPTTRGCLRLLDPRVREESRVADIGAGSGILSIAAALLGARQVVAVELDPWAVTAARENVEANGVADRVEVRSGAVGPAFLPGEPPFDGILANIEAAILLPLLAGFRSGVRDGGWLILSGILSHDGDRVQQVAATHGFRLDAEDREGDWWSGAFTALPPDRTDGD
jgi:ribosomal protein L11 methyltransferase